MIKKNVIYFHNGSGGGVLTIIKNLLNYKQHAEIENSIIFTINKDLCPFYEIPNSLLGFSCKVFYYSSTWNFYFTCKQLRKLIPDEESILIANDWLELGMISLMGLQNPVVQILHGNYDYYFDLAIKHRESVDSRIVVNSNIKKKLSFWGIKLDESTSYVRFPVDNIPKGQKTFENLNFAFFVNDLSDPNKQFDLIPLIDTRLLNSGLAVTWHIAGGGISTNLFKSKWREYDDTRIFYYGSLDKNGIDNLLLKSNVMILPSLNEGLPVSVVEGMKAGLVPFVTNWNNGISDLIIDGETGYFIDPTSPTISAQAIKNASKFPLNLSRISQNASLLANSKFNPKLNTHLYEEIFLDAYQNRKYKERISHYGSTLDRPYIPNIIVNTFRKYTSWKKNFTF